MTKATLAHLFRDPTKQAEFERTGVVKLRLFDADRALSYRDIVAGLDPEDGFDPDGRLGDTVTYHMTELDTRVAYKQRVFALANEWLQDTIDTELIDYRGVVATLFVKPPGKGEIPMHADWTIQEDNARPTLYLWVALEDVDDRNGPVRFVEGSHSLFDEINGPLIMPSYRRCEKGLAARATTSPMRAGEAILFDSSILHTSADNLTDKPRFALRLACIPKDRTAVLHRRSSEHPDVVETFRMETDDYLSHDGKDLTQGRFQTPQLGQLKQPDFAYSPEEMEEILSHADEIRAGERRIEDFLAKPAAPPPPPTLPQRLYRGVRRRAGRVVRRLWALRATKTPAPAPTLPDYAPYPVPQDMPRPFADPAIDEPLHRQGYVTLPFLDEAEVDRLTAAVRAAEGVHDRGDVHIPTQFRLSAFSNDGAYKERLYDAVWETLKARVETLLPGFEPLVINLFDKQPGSGYDPVPIHQNPSFVDEPAHKSVSLWIPLDDVDKDNGTVGVLPGSHNRFNRMRAGNMAHEDIFAPVQRELERELFVPVVLKKGEMVALDDSIIHWSYPNVSDRPRVAVQLIMVPKGVPHIYYFYDDETAGHPMMDLYEVDRHFFFGFNCKARPLTLKQIDRVPYRYRPIIAAELTAH